MRQSFEKFRKPTRREKFLNDMDRVIPWNDPIHLCVVFQFLVFLTEASLIDLLEEYGIGRP